MKITKDQIQKAFSDLHAKPVFSGSDVFLLFGEPVETNKIENMSQLINHVFAAGQNSKIREVKQVLNIIDPRV